MIQGNTCDAKRHKKCSVREPTQLAGKKAPRPHYGVHHGLWWLPLPAQGGSHGRVGRIFPTGCFGFSRVFIFRRDFSVCAVILLFQGIYLAVF